VLVGGAWIGVGVGVTAALAATGGNANSEVVIDSYPLARPDDPITFPITEENPPIADDLDPATEAGGAFKILNYDQYLAPGIMKDFGEQYGVEVQVTPYTNYDGMMNLITASGAEFDLVFPGPSILGRMVFGQLLQPLNHSYLPSLKNVWPEYQDPWYDQKARYTVPYTVYTTGVCYRADRVSNPDEGYMMIWNPDYKGKVSVLDDSGESIGMSMLAWDITSDINTGDPALIQAATDKLIDLVDLVSVKVTVSQFEKIPNGELTVAQGWSGDMLAAQFYLPKGVSPDVIGYWVPDSPRDRVIGNDVIAIPKSANKPILAHKFLDYLLSVDGAYRNMGWNGYQQPLDALNAKFLVEDGFIPDNIMSAVVVPEDFATGLTFYETPPAIQNEWLAAFQEFNSA
jgi:spermidine/putrescine transport system substrate-binding protein